MLGSFLKSSIVELKISEIILLGHISRAQGRKTTPWGVSGICGLRLARGWFFFSPKAARCGSGGPVENGLAPYIAVDNADPLQSLTGCLLVDVTIPQRNTQVCRYLRGQTAKQEAFRTDLATCPGLTPSSSHPQIFITRCRRLFTARSARHLSSVCRSCISDRFGSTPPSELIKMSLVSRGCALQSSHPFGSTSLANSGPST